MAVVDEINRRDVATVIKEHHKWSKHRKRYTGGKPANSSDANPLDGGKRLSRWLGPRPSTASEVDKLRQLHAWNALEGGTQRHVRVHACGDFFSQSWAGRQVCSFQAPHGAGA